MTNQYANLSSRVLVASLLLALLFLAACSQESDEDMTVRVMAVLSTVTSVTLEVTDSSGATNSYTATKNANQIAELLVPNVPLGSATLTARGLDVSGTVLYKGTKSVSVIANMPTVSVLMSRLSSTLTTTAISGEAMDTAEVITATVGGAMQRLIMNNANSASGTLVGVATGSNLTVSAQSTLADGTVVRTGSTSNVIVSEAGGSTTVVLNAVPAGTQPPTVSNIALPTEAPKVGVPYTVTVNAADPDGDLATISLDWGDGNAPVSQTVSGGSATFTHTYTTPGSVTISATAFDAEGSNSLAESVTVTVESADPTDTDSDVPVEIDVGDELSQVDLTVTGVPAGTSRVQATISSAALSGTITAELAPTAAGWFGKLELPQNAQYNVTLTTNPGESDTDSTTTDFSLQGDASADVTLTFDPSNPGTDGGSGGNDNQTPVAAAGSDQTLTDGDDNGAESVTLDGSGSTDADGSIVSYVWSANGVAIPSGVSPTASFPVGSTVVTLSVTDNEGATDTDTVTITVNAPDAPTNQTPTADAGDNKTVSDDDDSGSEAVALDGSGSADSDGTLSYSWSENGSEIATGINPTVTLTVGAHTITLTVTDDDGATDTDTLTVTVEAAPVGTELAIVPVSSTCAGTPVGGTCTVSVALQNYSGTFQAFEFDAGFSNGNYSLVPLGATPGSLTSGWLVADGNRPGGISTNAAAGSGKIIKLTVQKNAVGSTAFTTSDGLIGGGNAPATGIAGIAGGSVTLP